MLKGVDPDQTAPVMGLHRLQRHFVTKFSTMITFLQGRLSAEKLQDERNTRVSSVLIALGTVMCVSPVCEKKAVFAVCQLMKEKNIEKELVIQVKLFCLPHPVYSKQFKEIFFF